LLGKTDAKFMTVEDICNDAALLSLPDRAKVVHNLLSTFPPPHSEISDAEADQRWAELESGKVEEMSHEDFVAGLDLPNK